MKLDYESIAFAIVKAAYDSKFKEEMYRNPLAERAGHALNIEEEIDKKALIREGLASIFHRLDPDIEVIHFSLGGETIYERPFTEIIKIVQIHDIDDDYNNLSKDFASVGEDLKIAIDKLEKMQSKYLENKEIKGKHRNHNIKKQVVATCDSCKGNIEKNSSINVKRNKR